MYAWLFRIMPGPTWLRIIEITLVAVACVLMLFQWVFPWAVDFFQLTENTVS